MGHVVSTVTADVKLGFELIFLIRQTPSTSTSHATNTSQAKAAKKQVTYSPFEDALSKSNPFEGLKRNETRDKLPGLVLGILGSYSLRLCPSPSADRITLQPSGSTSPDITGTCPNPLKRPPSCARSLRRSVLILVSTKRHSKPCRRTSSGQ